MWSGAEEGAWHASERSVFAARRFLAVAAAIARGVMAPSFAGRGFWEMPTIVESVAQFVPTAVRFRVVPAAPTRPLKRDVDHALRARFYTGVSVEEVARSVRGCRLARLAVTAFLAPPARPEEVDRRAALLAAAGAGVPLRSGPRALLRELFEGLTRRERRRLPFIPVDEQVALEAVLVSRDRLLCAFSKEGDWPGCALVREVAGRLPCPIVRVRLDVVPPPLVWRLRYVRYERARAAAYLGARA